MYVAQKPFCQCAYFHPEKRLGLKNYLPRMATCRAREIDQSFSLRICQRQTISDIGYDCISQFRNCYFHAIARGLDNATRGQHSPRRRQVCTCSRGSEIKAIGATKLQLDSPSVTRKCSSSTVWKSGGNSPGGKNVFKMLAALRTLSKRVQHVTKKVLMDEQQHRVTLADAGEREMVPRLAATGFEQRKRAIRRMLRGAALPYRYHFGS